MSQRGCSLYLNFVQRAELYSYVNGKYFVTDVVAAAAAAAAAVVVVAAVAAAAAVVVVDTLTYTP